MTTKIVSSIVRMSLLAACTGLLLIPTATALAGTDLIVGELMGDLGTPTEFYNWGKNSPSDTVTAYSIGTTSCNLGDTEISWALSGVHPVIGQQAYRIANGRFEQLGMSWVKHGFASLNEDACNTGFCNPGPSNQVLYPGCSDPYGANLNGNHFRTGPRRDINASTGANVPGTPSPYNSQFDFRSDKYFKRLVLNDDDIDPALNPNARYFVEGLYITPDDITHGTQLNNASYREFEAIEGGPDGSFDLQVIGSTVRELPALYAWQALDPTVEISLALVPNDGAFYVACKVTDLGNGSWDYEYFVYNSYSHRSCGSVRVPFGADVEIASTGFHDVHYRDGDGHVYGVSYSGTDWTPTVNASDITFATTPFATNPNANAIRWGTGYNVRFVANAPPISGNVTLGLFRPGTPTTVDIAALVPDDAPPPALVLGDMDASGSVEMPDVPLFVAVLLDPGAATPDAALRADMTEDTDNNAEDIAMFVAALLGTP